MDNLKYYNDSLAYDFDMFMTKPVKKAEPKDNIVVMPKVKAKAVKRKKAAAKKLSSPILLLFCGIIVLAGFCGNIGFRIKINEINEDINEVKASIAELDSEMTSLEVEMQRRISYSNLELQAVELGMVKPGKENVKYIRVNDKNVAKTSDGNVVSE